MPSVKYMSTHEEDVAKVAELASKARTALLTTVDADGRLVSRPLGMQDREFDGDLWFFTQDPSPKVDDIVGNQNVNVAFESSDGWVSIAGSAEISRDPAMIDELWNKYAEAWFEGGRQDPTVALVKVTAHSAEYWAIDEPKPVQLLKVAKALVTGDTPDVGESHTVQF